MDLATITEAARAAGVNKSTISRQVRRGLIPNRGTASRPLVSLAELAAARRDNLDPSKQRDRSRGAGGEAPAIEAGAVELAPAIEAPAIEAGAAGPALQAPAIEAPAAGDAAPRRTYADVKAEQAAIVTERMRLDMAARLRRTCSREAVEAAGETLMTEIVEMLDARRRGLAERLAAKFGLDAMEIEADLEDADDALREAWGTALDRRIAGIA